MADSSLADERADAMALVVRPSVSALYGILIGADGTSDGGELVGTGLFVRMRERICVLTAAHVAQKKDDLEIGGARRYAALAHSTANGSKPAFIRSRYLCLGEPEDLAFALADAEALRSTDVVAVSLERFAASPDNYDHFVLGFPAKDSKFVGLLGAHFATALPFLTQKVDCVDPYFNPEVHFALQYLAAGVDRTGCRRELPDPHGISGSPVWAVEPPTGGADLTPPKVVGVVQRHDPATQALIVTRGDVVRRFLEQKVDREFANL